MGISGMLNLSEYALEFSLCVQTDDRQPREPRQICLQVVVENQGNLRIHDHRGRARQNTAHARCPRFPVRTGCRVHKIHGKIFLSCASL